MSRLFYCPKCKKEEIRNDDPYRNEHTLLNIRGGYGRPITHYKCECGNYLAGSINVIGWTDEECILYCKELIEEYNKGGCCFSKDMTKKAKQCYEDRKKNSKTMNFEDIARFSK